MTANKYINRTETEQDRTELLNRAMRTYIYAHESRDTIKPWSFDKVDLKAKQFPIPNVSGSSWLNLSMGLQVIF